MTRGSTILRCRMLRGDERLRGFAYPHQQSGIKEGVTSEPTKRQIPGPRRFGAGELPPIVRDPSAPTRRRKFRPWRFGIKTIAFVVVVVVFVLPLIPDFREAADKLFDVNPLLLVVGVAFQVASWFCYSLLTNAALGEGARPVSELRMFRIQMSTKALSGIVPGGNAAGSALGYRLMTLSGIKGPDAGFALATAGIGSAVVLNLILWLGLMISIPRRGVNPLYASAALAGVIIMLIAVALVLGVIHGRGRAERVIRWIAGKLHVNGDKATDVLRQVGTRMEELFDDKQLLKRTVIWAAAHWLTGAASLWVFLRAFDTTLEFDALIVVFGLANVMAVIPLTPGGLGVVDATYVATLVGFGVMRHPAVLAVAAFRIAQLWLPIVVGGFLYATLRIGPWRIERRDHLARLRALAHEEEGAETQLEFLMRAWPKRMVRPMPDVRVPGPQQDEDVEDPPA